MGRIPTAPLVSPGAIQGDRLSMNAPDMSPIGRGIQQLGGALKSLGEEYQANQQKMETYNANLAIERAANDAEIQYQNNLNTASPDGTDLVDRQSKSLDAAFSKVRSSITDPDLQMKANLVFEKIKGDHTLRGMRDSAAKAKAYVQSTTSDAINTAIGSGTIRTIDQYNDYFDNAVKARIDSVISDPVERQDAYRAFGKQMRDAFFANNPASAVPRMVPVSKSGSVVSYSLNGVRRQPLQTGLESRIGSAVQSVYGPGYRAVVYSGGQPRKSEGGPRTGSTRHDHGFAADVYIIDPNGNRVRGEKLAMLGQYWLANKVGGVGMEMRGGGIHLDAHTDRARTWNYASKGGSYSPEQASRVAAGLRGETPPLAYVSESPAMPQGGIFTGMEPDEWSQITTHAVKADEQRIKAEQEQRRVADDATVKAGYDLVFSGGLTSDWIEANRESLSPSEYRYFNETLRKPETETKSDTETYTALIGDAMKGEDQSFVQDAAFAAFSEGKLTKTDFGRIVTASRRTTAERNEKPWLADIRKTLSSRLAPTDAEDTEQYAKRLDGLFALDDWVDANPKATRDEIKKKAGEIADEYSKAVVNDMRAGLDMPKYSTVNRYAMTGDSLAVSAQKLASAFRAGKINAEELNRETALLKRWKTVLDEEARLGPTGP